MSDAPLTLEDANAWLRDHGVRGRFTAPLLQAALSRHQPGRIRHAIGRASYDRGAHRFVLNLLAAAGEPDSRGVPSRSGPPRNGRSRGNGRTVTGGYGTLCPDELGEDRVPQSRPRRNTRQADRPRQPREDARTERVRTPRGEARTEPESRRFPLTFKAYGSNAALEFRAHVANASNGKQPYHTVMLEGARALGGRRYDWNNKIVLQMMQRELPEVAAVLAGVQPSCEFRNHGPQKNKGFFMEMQGDSLFVKVFRSGDDRLLCAVPVPAEDVFYVNALVLRQIARTVRGTDPALIGTALRAYSRMKLHAGRENRPAG